MVAWIRRLGAEPRAPDPPSTTRIDRALYALIAAVVVIELLARDDLGAPEALGGVAFLAAIPARRRHPLAVVALAFGAALGLSLAEAVRGVRPPDLYATVFLLTLPYALVRWASGREALAGASMIAVAAVVGVYTDGGGAPDAIGAFAILFAAMMAGLAVRASDRARRQQIAQVKAEERAEIARNLHDTVAHHVSGIAIRAQAGLATADRDPEAAQAALRVVAAEASRTLDEMRAMVGSLRTDEPERAPQAGLRELAALEGGEQGGPRVAVALAGPLEDLPSSVASALFRLAQEAVTNARRHARRARRIEVEVRADEGQVRLQVTDDGELVERRGPVSVGYGLIGMRERAERLGGRCEAGPGSRGGWTVTAVLPRRAP